MPALTTRTNRPSQRVRATRPAPPAAGKRWAVRLTVAVGLVCLVECVRVPPSYVAWAFLALLLPALLLLFSPVRHAAIVAAARLWQSADLAAPGRPLPWKAALAFVLVPSWLVYLSSNRSDIVCDTWPVVPTAVSLLSEGDANLDEFYRQAPAFGEPRATINGLPFYLLRRGAHVYSFYPAGMTALAMPVVGLSTLTGGHVHHPAALPRLEKLTAATVGAVTLAVFFLVALHLARPGPALVMTWMLAIASGMFTTVGQNLWQHGGVILWALLALLAEFRGPSRTGTAVQGICCAMISATRMAGATFLLPFGLWVLVRSPRRAVALAGWSALAYVPWALYYHSIYGSPFGPSSTLLAGSFWVGDPARTLPALLLSPGRGLLIYQPWIVLAMLALVPPFRRSGEGRAVTVPAGWGLVCLSAIVLQVAMLAVWRCWWGGWCWGSRLLLETVPLWALLCIRPVAVLWISRWGRALLLALALLGTLVQLPAVYLGAYRWNAEVNALSPWDQMWSWSHAPFFEPFTRPERGKAPSDHRHP